MSSVVLPRKGWKWSETQERGIWGSSVKLKVEACMWDVAQEMQWVKGLRKELCSFRKRSLIDGWEAVSGMLEEQENAITYSWECFTPMIALFLKNIGITSGIISWTAYLTSGGRSITCLLNTQAVFSQAQFCMKLLNDSFLIEFLAWNGCPKLTYRLFSAFNSSSDYKMPYPIHSLSSKSSLVFPVF